MATINESKTSASEILDRVEQDGIEFIRFWFTDINGQLKSFAVGKEELDTLEFEAGVGAARELAADGATVAAINEFEAALALWRGPAFVSTCLAVERRTGPAAVGTVLPLRATMRSPRVGATVSITPALAAVAPLSRR